MPKKASTAAPCQSLLRALCARRAPQSDALVVVDELNSNFCETELAMVIAEPILAETEMREHVRPAHPRCVGRTRLRLVHTASNRYPSPYA